MVFKAASYIRFIKNKSKILLVTRERGVYTLGLKNKAVKFLQQINKIAMPSSFDFLYPRLVVASKLEQKVLLIDLKSKKDQLFETDFHYLCLHQKGLIISRNFFVDIYLDSEEKPITVRTPLRKIRFGGVYPDHPSVCYFFGEGMLLLLKNLFSGNAKYLENNTLPVKKKIITKELPRVYQPVVGPHSLGFIGIDFKEMLTQIDNPIISKKIF